jgi:hypothetical protein
MGNSTRNLLAPGVAPQKATPTRAPFVTAAVLQIDNAQAAMSGSDYMDGSLVRMRMDWSGSG